MASSFYFYDVETSGFNPRSARVMQFAGQRTNLQLKPIGQPDNFLIKMTPDVLPEPDAVLLTGITPQKTLAEGITEAEFLRYFSDNIATSDTVFLGFNTVRFDDEFIRFLHYRNFYDPYEWQWQDGRSKWDLLDVSRMTRALRPDGIEWPYASDGKPSNKLSLLSAINKLSHEQVHDALSDVQATIAVASLIRKKQPKLFDYLLSKRDKKQVEDLVTKPEPFIYSSGSYSSSFLKTTAAVTLTPHPAQSGSVYVYDLRCNPEPYLKKTTDELAELLAKYYYEEGEERFPIKKLQFNRCPAIAPLSVLDTDSQKRLNLDLVVIDKNLKILLDSSDFIEKLQDAILLNEKQKQTAFVADIADVDSQLYNGFFNDKDKAKMAKVRQADQNALADLHPDFDDSRLDKLLFLYKARQYPKSLSDTEQKTWENYCQHQLLNGNEQSRLANYFKRIDEIAKNQDLNQNQKYLLEELKLYGEYVMPA